MIREVLCGKERDAYRLLVLIVSGIGFHLFYICLVSLSFRKYSPTITKRNVVWVSLEQFVLPSRVKIAIRAYEKRIDVSSARVKLVI